MPAAFPLTEYLQVAQVVLPRLLLRHRFFTVSRRCEIRRGKVSVSAWSSELISRVAKRENRRAFNCYRHKASQDPADDSVQTGGLVVVREVNTRLNEGRARNDITQSGTCSCFIHCAEEVFLQDAV